MPAKGAALAATASTVAANPSSAESALSFESVPFVPTQTFIDPKDRLSRTLTTFLQDCDRRYAMKKSKAAEKVESF
jgi:hypothetical protein